MREPDSGIGEVEHPRLFFLLLLTAESGCLSAYRSVSMANISFKRVFHPVGQGAFFTEQLLSHPNGDALFNVVYDCGTFTDVNRRFPIAAPKLLRDKIDMSFNRNSHIDLLFISHFDGDHTNGLDYLLNNTTMDSKTIAVIPFKYPFLIVVMEDDYPELAQFIYNAATQKNVHFVGMMGSNSAEFSGRAPINIEKLIDKNEIVGQQLISIKPQDTHKPIWYYLPFMLSGADKYENEFINQAENVADLNDIQSVIAKKEELKKIYKDIGERIGRNTKINTNSLLMLSYPASPGSCVDYARATTCDNYFGDYCKWNRGYIRCKFSEKENVYPGSCMYTGDTSSDSDDFWAAFNNVLCSYLSEENPSPTFFQTEEKIRLALFQIPHHGSGRSNDERIVNENRIYAAFTNFSPNYWQKIYDPNISLQFYLQRKPLILVTNDDSFRFEESWTLKYKKEL